MVLTHRSVIIESHGPILNISTVIAIICIIILSRPTGNEQN